MKKRQRKKNLKKLIKNTKKIWPYVAPVIKRIEKEKGLKRIKPK